MKKITWVVSLVALLVLSSFSIALAKPAVVLPEDVERGVFVDHGYSSPPWYPPEEETDSYKWAPKYYWANPSLTILVNPTASGFPSAELDAVITEVAKGFAAWDAASVPFSAVVSRNDTVGPSLVTPGFHEYSFLGNHRWSWGHHRRHLLLV